MSASAGNDPADGGLRIAVRSGPGSGSSQLLSAQWLHIGRDASCGLVLSGDDVEPEHASIKGLGEVAEIRDLGSGGGTFVNGERIERATLLEPGDEVRIGASVLSLEATGQGPAVAPAAAASAGAAGGAAGGAASGGGGLGRRAIVGIGVGAVVLVAAIVAIVVAATGGSNGPLSESEILEAAKPSTLLVVGRSHGVTPLSGSGGQIVDSGSAWVYDAEKGLLVTNAHVVQNAGVVQAGFDSTTLTHATIVGLDARDDLAVLRVSPGDLPGLATLPLADPESVEQGATVYALGFPGNGTSESDFLKTPFQATAGTISALDDQVTVNYDAFEQPENENAGLLLTGLYQTDAAINPGNSGGPLVNDHGELVGVNVASSAGQNQNDAISIKTVQKVVPQLAEGKSVAWLGLGLSALSSSLAGCPQSSSEIGFCLVSESEIEGQKFPNTDLRGGMLVSAVTKDTPVDQQTELAAVLSQSSRNGFYVLVTAINNVPITTQQQYVNETSQIESGQQVEMTHLDVTLDPHTSNVGPFTETFHAP